MRHSTFTQGTILAHVDISTARIVRNAAEGCTRIWFGRVRVDFFFEICKYHAKHGLVVTSVLESFVPIL